MSLQKPPTEYIAKLQKELSILNTEKIVVLAEKMKALQGTNRRLFLAGNGGSSATASHAACDLGKTILPYSSRGSIKAICLSDSVPLLTAWGNDSGYEFVFSEQLRNLATKDDFFMVISSSGNSPNILKAITVAQELGVETFGLLGFDGGKAKDMVDDYLLVPVDDYGITEDVHMMTIHAVTDALKHE